MSRVILRTVFGSHLYGMNHAGSDVDYIEVVMPEEGEQLRNTHSVTSDLDVARFEFGSFIQQCFHGTHHALEALFSEKATVHELVGFREAYRPGTEVIHTYMDAIKQLHGAGMSGDFKRRRHAIRLTLNLNELLEKGKFNPTLSEEQIEFVNAIANRTLDEYRAELIRLLPVEERIR